MSDIFENASFKTWITAIEIKFRLNLTHSFLESVFTSKNSWTMALIEAFIEIWLHMVIRLVQA
jgi:hypothetical protein